jgi:serine/threonine protein kinase
VQDVSRGPIKDFYDLEEHIGEGSFGQVIKAKHRITQRDVAVKIISKKNLKNKEDMKRLNREV